MSSSLLIAIVPSLLLFVSEILPFVPVKYNGIAHAVFEVAKDIAIKYGIRVVDEPLNVTSK
jgi:hypothetical protein